MVFNKNAYSGNLQLKGFTFALIILLALVLTGIEPRFNSANAAQPFVDVQLHRSKSSTFSAIVTASSSDVAKAAILEAGGKVTSDLWSINGAGADLTAKQLSSLERNPHTHHNCEK